MMTELYVRIRARLATRLDDRGISNVEAAGLVAAIGTGVFAVVAAYNGALDGLMEDFRSVFPGAGE